MTGDWLANFPPGLIMILGAVLVPFLPGLSRKIWMLALPVLAFVHLLGLEQGMLGRMVLFDLELTTLRVDRLGLIFGYIFLIATFLGVVYQLHVKGWLEQVATLIYAGSATGAIFAGDLVTLFLFWEGTAISSVFLIWAAGTPQALAAGQRYVLIQITSGMILLAATMIHHGQTGSIAFESFDVTSLAGLLIFLAFGIKAAFPLLHFWLKDAYPQATVTGAVILSAFTTKLAIYALARGFAGTEILIPIGTVMAAFPIVFALMENDFRRVLAYSLNSQLGFMVVGIGIGTELSLAGTAAHAVCSVLYQGLLFMSMGAVLMRTGTAKGSELGGLYRSMPITAAFCCIGAASISAFPLFSGFVSKSLIISASLKGEYFVTWMVLLFASAGAFLHSGFRVPFFVFFGRDSGLRPREAPKNMLTAMGIAAFLCIGIGVLPGVLYALLPSPVKYEAYTLEHIVTQMQILVFAAVVFVVFLRMGQLPSLQRAINLDVDWIWRKPVAWIAGGLHIALLNFLSGLTAKTAEAGARLARTLYYEHGPTGRLARTRPSGSMALYMAALLVAFMAFSFF